MFELDRVDYGRKLLRLKRVSKQDSLFSPQIGYRPHPFSAVNLHTDETLSLGDYKGRYVLLDFCGTWCGPCRAETPDLRMAYEQFNRSDLEIIGIGCDDRVEKNKGVLRQRERPMATATRRRHEQARRPVLHK